MPTPDEANAILVNLNILKHTGTGLRPTPDREGMIDTSTSQYERWLLWLNEAIESVQSAVPADAYVHKQAGALIEEASALSKPTATSPDAPAVQQQEPVLREATEVRRITARAGELIEAAERAVRVGTRLPFGDDFRRIVDITIKDAFFESWAFRITVGLFAVALAVIFGGAIYADVKISGIQERSEKAEQAIRDRSADFEKQLTASNKEIADKTSHIGEIISTVITTQQKDLASALKSAQTDLNTYINETKAKLDEQQTRVVGSLNTELHNHVQLALSQTVNGLKTEASSIESEWKEADKKVGNQLTAASAAIEGAKTEAVRSLKNEAASVEADKKAAVSQIEASKTEAKNNLETYRAEVIGKRDEILRMMARLQEDLKTKHDEEVRNLPERTRALADAVSSLDLALNSYHIDVASIVDKLSTGRPKTALGRVAMVLGASFWLVVSSLAVSVIAMFLAFTALFVRRRRLPAISASPAP